MVREKNKMGILQSTEKPIVKAMCGIYLLDRKMMLMLDLNETVDEWAIANV